MDGSWLLRQQVSPDAEPRQTCVARGEIHAGLCGESALFADAEQRSHGALAGAHAASSNPPSPDFTYRIEYSVDSGKSWSDMVQDWRITRQGEQPADFWSQSFCWGSANLPETASGVQVRFRNDGGKRNLRAEVHLAYRLPREDATRVTFHWKDHSGLHTENHTFAPGVPAGKPVWKLATGTGVETLWVEYAPEP